MTTPTRKTLPELVKAMSGRDTTDKWDVVVSYSLEQLNQFLASQYQAGTLAREVKLHTELEDDFAGDKSVDYDLRISSPALAFNSQTPGTAVLTMGIGSGSSYTVTPKSGGQPQTKSFPADRYSIQCVVPLAALSGTTGKTQQATGVISFEEGKEDELHIILDFKKTADTDYQLVPAPDPDGDELETIFLPLLANYFRQEVAAIDYALAAINNKAAGDGIVLRPTKFVLATAGTLGAGVLSIYILTDASGRDPGSPNPEFKPDGVTPELPVPSDHAVSIILSYDLITNVYFKSQLESPDGNGKKKYTVKTVASTDGASTDGALTEGIELRLITNESVVGEGEHDTYIGGGYSYDGLNVPIDANNPMALTIKDAKYTLSWSGSGTSEWSESTSGVDTGGGYQWGEVTFTITLAKGPTAFASLSDRQLRLIDLQLKSSDFKVDTSGGKCSFKSVITKQSTSVPSYYKNMTLQVPAIDLRLAGLNFFLETNLLSPGQEVVAIDTEAGVKTPHDFLLVGSFKSKAPSAS